MRPTAVRQMVPPRRAVGTGFVGVTALLLLSACASSGADGGGLEAGLGGDSGSAEVLVSQQYAATVGVSAQSTRLEQLRFVVDALRRDSTGGWQARQDDTTGYANDLSGGRFVAPGAPDAVARTFISAYGSAFGPAPATDLPVPAAPYDDAGVAVLTVPQIHAGIPVDGGRLLLPVTRRTSGGEISMVRGQVLPTAGAATAPTVTPAAAVATAAKAAGSAPTGRPTLVIFQSSGIPRLSWSMSVPSFAGGLGPPAGAGRSIVASGSGDLPTLVFVDALTGAVIGTRPQASHQGVAVARGAAGLGAQPTAATGQDLGRYDFTLPPQGEIVRIKGTLVDGREVTVNAERQPDGSIAMVDATGEGANRTTKKGIVALFDGHAVTIDSTDLGPLLTFPAGTPVSADAVLAMWSARNVMDYYRTRMGRLSFDGANSPLVISLNRTADGVCLDNAFFSTAPHLSFMAVGVPCHDKDGKTLVRTYADPTTIGHEITHGVTHTNGGDFTHRGNTMQQTAVDEGTSDYFGVLAEDQALGQLSPDGDRYMCYQLESAMCRVRPDGAHVFRPLDTGATYDDLAFTLTDPFGAPFGDDGHNNGMVWTNTLWSARQRLVALDGGDALASARARAFDVAVHRGTSLYLADSTDLIGAAESVLRAAAESKDLDGQDLETIRDAFVTSKLCRACTYPAQIPPSVAVSSDVKVRPQVAGDHILYTDYTARSDAQTRVGAVRSGATSALEQGSSAWALRTAAAGDWAAETRVQVPAGGEELHTVVLRSLPTGRTQTLSRTCDPTVAPALSSTAVAWADETGRSSYAVRFMPLGGTTFSTLPVSERIAHLATDGTRVAVYLQDGTLEVWDTAAGTTRRLATLGAARDDGGRIQVPSGGLAMEGSRVATMSRPLGRSKVLVFDLDAGTVTTLSDSAFPTGIAMDKGLVVWPEITGPLSGRINEFIGGEYPETSLYGYSFATKRFYEMENTRGQQGFPALSGGILAWQDTVLGGNDIFAMRVPEGT